LTDGGKFIYYERAACESWVLREGRILPLAGKRRKLKFLRQERPFLAEKRKFLFVEKMINDENGTPTGTPTEPTTTPEQPVAAPEPAPEQPAA